MKPYVPEDYPSPPEPWEWTLRPERVQHLITIHRDNITNCTIRWARLCYEPGLYMIAQNSLKAAYHEVEKLSGYEEIRAEMEKKDYYKHH